MEKLETSLIHLEKNPQDVPSLEEFLREAHTLKGDSRMLGVQDVETLIHQMEETMMEVKDKQKTLTGEICDRLHYGLDAVRKLVQEAVTGEASGVQTFLVLAQLMGADESSYGEIQEETTSETALFDETSLFEDELNLPVITPESEKKEVVVAPPPQEFAQKQESYVGIERRAEDIGTIRVKTEHLDDLARQSGELSIAQMRISRRSENINELFNLWEEWSRDFFNYRGELQNLQQSLVNDNFQKVQRFQQNSEQRLEKLGKLINQLRNVVYEDNASLSLIANEIETGVKNLRLLPLSNIFNPLHRLVRDLSRQQSKEINLVIEGGDTRADKKIIEEMKDPLLHIIRNAIDHGIETPQEREQQGKSPAATITLRGYTTGSSIGIDIVDDGRGLNLEKIKRTALRKEICTEAQLAQMNDTEIQSLIFASGFSTRTEVSEISGRGVGLDVVRANVEKLKGSIQVESTPGKGCQFRLILSTSLTTTDALMIEVNQTIYALPVDMVETMLLISRREIFALEGKQTITFKQQPISVIWLADLLELEVKVPQSTQALNDTAKIIPCIIMRSGTDYLGIMVNSVIDQQDIVLKPQSALLKKVPNITGATILGNGEVCMVLNPQDLLASVKGGKSTTIIQEAKKVQTKPKLLLVEDSIIIRTQMKRILEGAGYELTIAVDGAEGFKKLRAGNFDVVLSDVEMPNMNGLELTRQIRQYPEYREMPIILVTTLAKEEDRRKGAAAGANAYLTKGDFDQKLLLDTLKRLV